MENVLPEMRFNRGYYDGTGQAIMKRVYEDNTKPNNRIVKNYCKTTVENFRGYITGIPITYSPHGEEDISSLLDCFLANDVQNSDSEWLKNALIYGQAPQLCYVNEKQEKRFKNINPENVIPVYSADLDEELLYAIYYYPNVDWDSDEWDTSYSVNVYTDRYILHFTADSSISNLVPTGEVEEHYFKEVPFSIFYLTDDGESIFKCVVGLQDAYNKLLSDSVNDWEAFVDAYLVMKDVEVSTEDIQEMKENRIILLDETSEASYLTKSTTDTQVQNLLEEVNTAIHTIANSPDFSSEEFGSGVSSGIALQFKLVGFNNIAANIEGQFRKAINRRIDLLNNVFSLLDTAAFDVDITFNHNLPQNLNDTVDMVSKLKGIVSDETLLAQIPFVDDVDKEIERLNAVNPLAELYDFGGVEDEEEPEE